LTTKAKVGKKEVLDYSKLEEKLYSFIDWMSEKVKEWFEDAKLDMLWKEDEKVEIDDIEVEKEIDDLPF
jgi:hypothetical protein